ncbi:hypothetical protein E2C01_021196 [Portunus trituberculatus]|uniref:Uncharacterized protein n=1 Tax=Portunus trituberculatus TaxID=210409 RepID=A0A5B7E406_PORTR|nr:hypothetical protein [Portunus trituberculatus]
MQGGVDSSMARRHLGYAYPQPALNSGLFYLIPGQFIWAEEQDLMLSTTRQAGPGQGRDVISPPAPPGRDVTVAGTFQMPSLSGSLRLYVPRFTVLYPSETIVLLAMSSLSPHRYVRRLATKQTAMSRALRKNPKHPKDAS